VALTQDQIEKFVGAWYYALDVHAPEKDLLALVTDKSDVHIEFPDSFGNFSIAGFKKWLERVYHIFFDENHNVVSVSVNGDINAAEVKLDVVVAWQASFWMPPAAKSRRTSMNATQEWVVRASDKNEYGVEIVSYIAAPPGKPFAYAPGFAPLVNIAPLDPRG